MRREESITMPAYKSRKKGIWKLCLLWILIFFLAAIMLAFSLAFSQEGIPVAPAGKEKALAHIVDSVFQEGELALTGDETAALLFPFLKNALSEKINVTGLSLRMEGENEISLALGFRAFGNRLGLFSRMELLPEKNGYYGVRIASVSLGKLPLPPRWIMGKAEAALSSFCRVEGDVVWFPSSVPVSLWEGTDPIALKLSKIAIAQEELRLKVSVPDIPLDALRSFLGR